MKKHFQVLLMQQRAIKYWRKFKIVQENIKCNFINTKGLHKTTQRDLDIIQSNVDQLNIGELEIWQSFIFARNEFMIHELVFDGIENYNSKTDAHKTRRFNRIMRDLGPYSAISAKTLLRYLNWEDANGNVDFADFDDGCINYSDGSIECENDWEFNTAIPTTTRKYCKDVSVLLHNVIGDINNCGLTNQLNTYDYSTTYDANVAQFERFGNSTFWRADESSKNIKAFESFSGDDLRSKNAYSLIDWSVEIDVANQSIESSESAIIGSTDDIEIEALKHQRSVVGLAKLLGRKHHCASSLLIEDQGREPTQGNMEENEEENEEEGERGLDLSLFLTHVRDTENFKSYFKGADLVNINSFAKANYSQKIAISTDEDTFGFVLNEELAITHLIDTFPVKNNYIPSSNERYPQHISSDFRFGSVTEKPDRVGDHKFKNCVFESKNSSNEIISKLEGLLDAIRLTNNEILEGPSFNLESTLDLPIISGSIHENLIVDTSSYKNLIVDTDKHYCKLVLLKGPSMQGFEDIPTSKCSRLTVVKSVDTLRNSFVSAKGLKSNSNDPFERMMNKDTTFDTPINQSECHFAQSDHIKNFPEYGFHENSIDCSLRNISSTFDTQFNNTRHAQEHLAIVPFECFRNISSKIMENEVFSHIIVNNFPFVRLQCSEVSDKINIQYSGNSFADRNDIGIQISEILPKDLIRYSTVGVILELTQDSQKEAKVQNLQEQYPTLIWWVPSEHHGYINWKYKGHNEEEKQLIATQLKKALKFYKSREFFDSLF